MLGNVKNILHCLLFLRTCGPMQKSLKTGGGEIKYPHAKIACSVKEIPRDFFLQIGSPLLCEQEIALDWNVDGAWS